MNTTKKGNVVEIKVAAKLAEKGYVVSLPLVSSRYDLVAEKENKFFRIQCKKGRTRNGYVIFDTNTISRSKVTNENTRTYYSKNDIDMFAVLLQRKNLLSTN